MKIRNLVLVLTLGLTINFVVSPAIASAKTCSPTQAIEEGPYYLASTPTRSDVTDGQTGMPLTIKFKIQDANCKAIKGARVDIWFANANGVYSGVASKGDDLGAGTNSGLFLRGTQFTDTKGFVTFKGIYPGWYPARTIHIHEKIWIGNKEVLTTQTFFTDSQNAKVMSTSPYKVRGTQRVTNKTDMVLNRGTVKLSESLMTLKGSTASAIITVKP
jgi:protocatechuate 3,4-dioxygenase beta subunit